MDEDDQTSGGAIRGFVIALPFSLALWGLIWWVVT